MGHESTRWQRLQDLFDAVRALPMDQRDAYLDRACAGDDALRQEIGAMVAADGAEYALGIERLVNEAVPLADPFVGMRLGAWRTLGRIGRGGMGTVYLAERADGQYEQRVALKIVSAAGPAEVAALMFQAERRILARLSHPNIARLLDAGLTPEGSAYMVMELVDGLPITAYCDTHRLGVDARLRLFRTVCDATQHAHGALVVHRDLKPSNIFVSREGQVKLLDFGIAKLLEPEPGFPDRSTRAHPALTLAYAAPEQLRGDPVTTATDVYALGVVLYELLAGRSPFDAPPRSPLEAERRITTTDPEPPSHAAARPARGPDECVEIAQARNTTPARLARRLHGDLDRIVLKALRGDPARRYHSAGQLAEDIDRCLAGRPVSAQADSFGYRARRFVGRNRLAVASAAALLLVLTIFSIAMAVQAGRIAAERDRARAEQTKAEQVVRVLVDLFQLANPEVVPGGDRLNIGDFLERAEARALRDLEGQPELASRMRHVLGLVHHARSDTEHARDLLEASFAERRRISGPDAPDTLAVQVDLGRLLVFLDHREPARALLEDALDRVRRALGAEHALAADAYHSLAALERAWEEAHDYLQRAVAIARRQLPPTDQNRITYVTSLANLYRARGRYAEARALLEEAQRGAENIAGGRTPVLAKVLNELAILDGAVGDYAAAEAKHRRALAIAADVVGPDSFQMADGLNDLAVVLASQGRLREAAEAFRDAYDRHVVIFGERHWRTLNAMRNVGMSLFLLDDPAGCEGWMRRAVDGHESAGTRDRFTVYMHAQLARCIIRSGRTEEGLAVLTAALEALDREGSEAADYRAQVRLWLGTALLDAGELTRAEGLVAAATEHQRRNRPPEHPARAEAECELAHVRAASRRFDEAAALAEACVPRIAGYGQMVPWRKQSAEALLRRLRARGSEGGTAESDADARR